MAHEVYEHTVFAVTSREHLWNKEESRLSWRVIAIIITVTEEQRINETPLHLSLAHNTFGYKCFSPLSVQCREPHIVNLSYPVYSYVI